MGIGVVGEERMKVQSFIQQIFVECQFYARSEKKQNQDIFFTPTNKR